MKPKITVSEKSLTLRNKYFPLKVGEYSIISCDQKTFSEQMGKLYPKVFPPSSSGFSLKANSKEAKKLSVCIAEYQKIHSEYFLFFYKKKAIGWFMGEMEDFETFYMRNTGVLPIHQSKGIYSAFLDQFISYLKDLGYQRISSQHAPHNKRIYNLKMSKGFIIVGSENHERWGNLIKLVKFLDKKREAYYIKKFD